MRDEERFYKREEDLRRMQSLEERVHKLETAVVSLTTAQVASTDDINELANSVQGLNEVIHGELRNREDSGLVGQANALDTELKRISRIMDGGLLKNHNELWDVYTGKKQGSEKFWDNTTKILIAVIAGLGGLAMLLKEWPSISDYWLRESKNQKHLHKQMERAKTRRKTVAVFKTIPAHQESQDVGARIQNN